MQLWKNGTLWGHEQRRLEVWRTRGDVNVADWLCSIPTMRWPAFSARPSRANRPRVQEDRQAWTSPSLAGVKCLLIAPDVTAADLPAAQEALWDFTHEGGRTLILRQQTAVCCRGKNHPWRKRAYFSQSYVRLPDHPP